MLKWSTAHVLKYDLIILMNMIHGGIQCHFINSIVLLTREIKTNFLFLYFFGELKRIQFNYENLDSFFNELSVLEVI